MPGGIGLDDDDETMEDMQHAQDMIPPPLTVVNLEDIERSKAGLSFLQNNGPQDVGAGEYAKNQQDIDQGMEQLKESSTPVFQKLVYDPTALMELQSIPSMIPERLVPGAAPSTAGVASDAALSTQETDAAATPPNKTAEGVSTSLSLTPIPILSPPTNKRPHASPNASMETNGTLVGSAHPSPKSVAPGDGTDGLRPKENGTAVSTPFLSLGASGSPTTTSDQARSAFVSSHEAEMFSLQHTPLGYRNAIIKQLKMAPKSKLPNKCPFINLHLVES
jgi:hypothetical protein